MKPTSSLLSRLRRLRLTTKQASKGGGYYKGTGSGPMGRHTKHGGYIIDWARVRTYIVPAELKISKLSPFVDRMVRPREARKLNRSRYGHDELNGKTYLQDWKTENGTD